MQKNYPLFIDGKWTPAVSGKTFKSIYPYDQSVNAVVAEADAADVNLAVEAAARAFPGWSRIKPAEREQYLRRMAELARSRREELARITTLDTGKPIREAYGDVDFGIEILEYYAGIPTKIHGEVSPVSNDNMLNYVIREPIGVVGLITPWNFPFQLECMKIAPALACGNTVVLKPAEDTPLASLETAKIAEEAGLPKGVFNVVPGYGETAGATLVNHAKVGKISFTGEVGTGKLIMRNCAETLKRITLELGGKTPNIIFADADVEEAARTAVMGAFYNQGEICCAGTRIFLEQSIYDQAVAYIIDEAKKIRLGDPMDPKTQMGPMISRAHQERVLAYIEAGKDEGADLLCGGNIPTGEHMGKGSFINPTFFGKVKNNMKIAREEIFGPVGSILAFETVEEAIQQGNDTIFGLSAAVWTKDIKKALRMSRELQAGSVWINTILQSSVASPWGGMKQSGIGREYSQHAIEAYTQIKSVWIHTGEAADGTFYDA